MIKAMIWDLDNTLLDGVFLESPDQPPAPNPRLAGLLHELAGRGILQAIASRNPPEAGQHAERVTGHAFAAIQCGWGAKSAAIRAIMAQLGLTADSVAFTDDDPMERAEVSFSLPDVLVLAPDEVTAAANWPQFSPPVVTDEARRRGELYRQRRVRQEEARAFGGSREEFLRHSMTRVTIGPATSEDLPRLHELSVRTHQFNSAGTVISEPELASLLGSPSSRVVVVRLADRFGDDGLVGGCVLTTGPSWHVPLLMMSCRALGRGVVDAFLTWICRAALEASATQVALPCLITPRNVPLRIALTGAGFRADGMPEQDAAADQGASHTVVYVMDLAKPLPELPSWVQQ